MRLVIEDEAGTRSSVPFEGDEVVVGRAAEGVTFRLSDRDVSRRHARFLLQGGSPFVEDLGSLTGTRVNGERISGRRRLREGDLVRIGAYDLAVVPAQEAELVAGAPPPLPGPAREAARATGRFPVAAVPATAPRPGPRRPRRSVVLAGALALALGLAAGYAVGLLTTPPPGGGAPPGSQVTRP